MKSANNEDRLYIGVYKIHTQATDILRDKIFLVQLGRTYSTVNCWPNLGASEEMRDHEEVYNFQCTAE